MTQQSDDLKLYMAAMDAGISLLGEVLVLAAHARTMNWRHGPLMSWPWKNTMAAIDKVSTELQLVLSNMDERLSQWEAMHPPPREG